MQLAQNPPSWNIPFSSSRNLHASSISIKKISIRIFPPCGFFFDPFRLTPPNDCIRNSFFSSPQKKSITTSPDLYARAGKIIICLYVFFMKCRARERNEGCAIDFLFSSRTNNIPLTGCSGCAPPRNMKWKSMKIMKYIFFLSLPFSWPHLRNDDAFPFFHAFSMLRCFTYGWGIWFRLYRDGKYEALERRHWMWIVVKQRLDYRAKDLTLLYVDEDCRLIL